MTHGHKRAIINATCCGFDFQSEIKYLIFPFPGSGNEAKGGFDSAIQHAMPLEFGRGGEWILL